MSLLEWQPFRRRPGGPCGLLLVIFTLLHLATTTYSTRMHNVYWNASNPLFKTNNVIEINSGNHPWEYDQVNIVCPVYKPGTSEAVQEKYIIYSVSKEEYQSCRITQPSPKIIAVCNRPYDLMYFTITFRSFTPTPGGLEFHPGQDYYFISTSSRNDLHRRVGGGCSTNNMRIIFRVAEDTKVNAISLPDHGRPGHARPPLQDPWLPKQVQEDFFPSHSDSHPQPGNNAAGSQFRRQSRNDENKSVYGDASNMPLSSAATKSALAYPLVAPLIMLATQVLLCLRFINSTLS